MLTKQDKSQLRHTIFRHLDGIATATTAFTLHKKGILEAILKDKTVNLESLSKNFNANEGYLNVALRILCSQGWLNQELDNKSNRIEYTVNDQSKKAFDLIPLYEDVVGLLKYSAKFPEDGIGADAFITLERIFKKYESNYGITSVSEGSIEQQILKHIEGAIVNITKTLRALKRY